MNRLAEYKQALEQMMHHRLRTALTLLGMIFGVGAVVAMQNIGAGAERAALKSIESLGLHSVVVNFVDVYDTEEEASSRTIGLTQTDAQLFVDSYSFVKSYSALAELDVTAVASDWASAKPSVVGVTPDYLAQSAMKLAQGRVFSPADYDRFAQVAIIGPETAQSLFPNKSALGQPIKVNYQWFKVIGVLRFDDAQQGVEGVKVGGNRDRVFVPMTTYAMKLRNDTKTSLFNEVKFHLSGEVNQGQVAAVLQSFLLKRHGDIEDFSITVPADLLKQHQDTQRVFNWVMSAVAAISLLVGGIGIMNIMLATVLERTQEIGLRRAIGATKADITRQFLIETVMITFVGGLLGIVFGVALSIVIATLANWEVAFSFSAIIVAVLMCSITGLAFGIYPAKQAAELDPIQALQAS